MNAYKPTMKEEMAIRHWQNVISLGSTTSAEAKPAVKQNHKTMKFEVLP